MIICERCGKEKPDAYVNRGLMVSAGCYDVSGPPWEKFRRTVELVVCDDCMWDDPRYVEMYGSRR